MSRMAKEEVRGDGEAFQLPLPPVPTLAPLPLALHRDVAAAVRRTNFLGLLRLGLPDTMRFIAAPDLIAHRRSTGKMLRQFPILPS